MFGLITQRQIINQFGVKCDQLESEYVSFFEALGVRLRIVSNFQTFDIDNFDLLILTGGGNINKEQSERDYLEKKLFKQALEKKVPVIGICRGMQYINYLLGGKITENAQLKCDRPNKLDHEVKIGNDTIKVNNFHNDVIFVEDLSNKLQVLALDVHNNTVEAFYNDNVLGLQWHPERVFSDDFSKKYSTDLIKKYIKNKGLI